MATPATGLFNGTPASFTVLSPSRLVATVPSGATTGKITIATSTGTATSANYSLQPGSFTVTPLPQAGSGAAEENGVTGATMEDSGADDRT